MEEELLVSVGIVYKPSDWETPDSCGEHTTLYRIHDLVWVKGWMRYRGEEK